MRLGDWDNISKDGCKKLNIKLFIFYVNGELSRQEERLIDSHCGECADCRANLAYIYEIVKGKQKFSIDEQTLLLKYLQDPIYKDNIQKFKDKIKQEILTEIKIELSAKKLTSQSMMLTSDLINKHFSSNNTTISDSKSLVTKVKNSTRKTFTYSNIVLALSIAVLISLTTLTYLMLNKTSYDVPSPVSSSGLGLSYKGPIIPAIAKENKQTNKISNPCK